MEVKKFCTLAIESKSGNTQRAGFERPFLTGLFEAQEMAFWQFRDEPGLEERPWRTRHTSSGSCIDKLIRKCLRPEFSGYAFYVNKGDFDFLFMLQWLREHAEEFGFEFTQRPIQVLRVWQASNQGSKYEWEFLDSLRLLPMSLAKACQTFSVDSNPDHPLHRHEHDPLWEQSIFQECKSLALRVLRREMELLEQG